MHTFLKNKSFICLKLFYTVLPFLLCNLCVFLRVQPGVVMFTMGGVGVGALNLFWKLGLHTSYCNIISYICYKQQKQQAKIIIDICYGFWFHCSQLRSFHLNLHKSQISYNCFLQNFLVFRIFFLFLKNTQSTNFI